MYDRNNIIFLKDNSRDVLKLKNNCLFKIMSMTVKISNVKIVLRSTD